MSALTVSTPLCATRLDVDFTSSARTEQQRAKALCAGCPRMLACREEALQRRLFDAVRGGLTGRELRALASPRPVVVRHTRGSYVAGKCKCARCKSAHARYMASWRKRRVPVTKRPTMYVELPGGQFALALEIGDR